MTFFELDGDFEVVVANEVWLIPDFEMLLDAEYNVGHVVDPTGKARAKCFAVLKYIYLMYSWKSPNAEMLARDRHELALDQSAIEASWLEDMITIKAIKYFNKMQQTRASKMLDAVNGALDKLQVYFDTIDFTETDPMTGKPINSTKEFIANIAGLEKAYENLGKLEERVKKERTEKNALKGDLQPGMFDHVHFKS